MTNTMTPPQLEGIQVSFNSLASVVWITEFATDSFLAGEAKSVPLVN